MNKFCKEMSDHDKVYANQILCSDPPQKNCHYLDGTFFDLSSAPIFSGSGTGIRLHHEGVDGMINY